MEQHNEDIGTRKDLVTYRLQTAMPVIMTIFTLPVERRQKDRSK